MIEPRAFYSLAQKGRTDLWVWATGAALLLFAFYTLSDGLWRLMERVYELLNIPAYYNIYFGEYDIGIMWIFTNQLVVWTVITVPILAVIYLFQKYIRQRPLLDIVTCAPKFRWKRCLAGMVVAFLFIGLSTVFYMLINYIDPPAVTLSETDPGFLQRAGISLTFDLKLFLASLPVLLIFIPLNALMQEIVFRGILDQGLTRLTGNIVLAFIISALAFAFWHIQNYEAAFGTPFYLAGMFIFGLAMSTITYMDNGMEAAIGAHTAGNFFFYLIIGMEHPYTVPSWILSFGEPQSTLGTVFAEVAIWAFFLFVLSKWAYGLKDDTKPPTL